MTVTGHRHIERTGIQKSATAVLLAVALIFSLSGRCFPALAVHGETPPPDPVSLLADGLLACAEVVDLTDCALPVSELGQIYADLLHNSPALFHVALRLSYAYREITADGETVRLVTEVYPVYTVTGAELTAARALYRDTVNTILAEMDAVFGSYPRTEADTVLFLHDLLADRYAYDTRTAGTNVDALHAANADAYTFFRDGVGICQAYALAFLALARGAGLEADFVASDAMNHAWNHVRVDGVWYHVDVTRDDPIPAAGGSEEVNHRRLLRSDAGMAALGYHSYTCTAGHICTNTRFEGESDSLLADFSEGLVFSGGKWLGMGKSGGIVAAKLENSAAFMGQVGDTDLDGVLTPADLLAVYDPALPEKWREWMRQYLIKGT